MNISDFDYPLPEERIAKFPLERRDASKLLVWRGGTANDGDAKSGSEAKSGMGDISETRFSNIASVLPPGSVLVFNNTRVVRARLVMHKASGARIEILCLEPLSPSDYERAFAARGECEWSCIVGNSKKWKEGAVECGGLMATRLGENRVRFSWDADVTFGQLLEQLGRVPIPPYLGRDSEEIDNTRYQTVYAQYEGSVAAPTAGLHFTPDLIAELGAAGIEFDHVTLHVGAGTFLPVKADNALDHPMHTEHFEVTLATVEHLLNKIGHIVAVGTTSVRTLESLPALAWRIETAGNPETERAVGQFEPYDIPAEFDGARALDTLSGYMRSRGLDKIAASTRIMITPAGYEFRIVDGIVTNFHQPKSTLLLLVAAFTGGNGEWRRIYDYALARDFRFLSYGDSSILLTDKLLNR
jgi:S-adenosylmethionine:tRNA ribosyltransferase-isomerase